MENMCSIFMNPDTFLFFTIHITTHMITPFQYNGPVNSDQY